MEGTEHFEKFRQVLDELIRPAVEGTSLGLRVVRADDIYQSGSFLHDILDYLANAHTVIADVTGQNANVFYELGVRHTLSPRTILLARQQEDIPADLREYRALIYGDIARESVLQARRATLRRYFDEIEWEPEKPDNPVLKWLEIPNPPDDLRKRFSARLDGIGPTQRKVLQFLRDETGNGSDLLQSKIDGRFNLSGAEMYYRLEQLRLLGFIRKQRTSTREYAYGLTTDYRRDIGLPTEVVCPEVRLASPKGQRLRFGTGDAAPWSFFYYLDVRNHRDRGVSGVRVLLTRIRRFDGDDVLIEDYPTRMPVKWRTGQGGDRCVPARIPPDGGAVAVLGFIIKGYDFFQMDICADPWPQGFPAATYARQRTRVDVIVEFAGRESPPSSFEIRWNGMWGDDPETMQAHLTVAEVGE
jgi:hypothetical protein